MSYLHELKIGNVTLKNNILLAPMAGITNLPFRIICEKFEPGLVCTEMVSSKGIFYHDEKTNKLLEMENEKRPVAAQIFGNDIEAMSVATKKVSKVAEIVDINMGCPAPKVVKNGDGSKLMLDLEKARDIIVAVVQNASVPVTLKMRKGWDNEHVVAVELAKIAQQSGVAAITIHGRTRDEFFSGEVDLEAIRKVKEAVSIPVIGNGNIIDEESAKRMFEQTGVDGIMIGRASIGTPWIFKRILHYLQTGEKLREITNKEKLETILKHIELEVQIKGEKVGIPELRKHLACYVKSLPNASKIRQTINQINTKKELVQALKECF